MTMIETENGKVFVDPRLPGGARPERSSWAEDVRRRNAENATANSQERAESLIDKMRRILLNAADQCDEWADASEKGGGSTHQVQAQREYANQLRREAMRK
jgi:hypothetical protein